MSQQASESCIFNLQDPVKLTRCVTVEVSRSGGFLNINEAGVANGWKVSIDVWSGCTQLLVNPRVDGIVDDAPRHIIDLAGAKS